MVRLSTLLEFIDPRFAVRILPDHKPQLLTANQLPYPPSDENPGDRRLSSRSPC